MVALVPTRMWDRDNHMGDGWWWLMGVGWLLSLAFIGFLAYLLVRHVTEARGAQPGRSSAEDLLAERLVDGFGQAAGFHPGPQRGFQAQRVLPVCPPVTGEDPGVVVQGREEDDLASGDDWAVQGVADPQLVRPAGLEPAIGDRRRRQQLAAQAPAGQVPLDGALVR